MSSILPTKPLHIKKLRFFVSSGRKNTVDSKVYYLTVGGRGNFCYIYFKSSTHWAVSVEKKKYFPLLSPPG